VVEIETLKMFVGEFITGTIHCTVLIDGVLQEGVGNSANYVSGLGRILVVG